MSKRVVDCLSDDQLRSFRRAFEHYDKDKDGKVDIEGFRKALEMVGIMPTRDEFEAMCNDVGSDTITLVDFIAVIYYFLRGADTQEELIKAFSVFDKDNDGLIDVDTAREILGNLKHPVPENQVQDLMQKLGRGGQVDYAEMIRELRPQ